MSEGVRYRLAWFVLLLLTLELVLGSLHSGVTFDERYNLQVPRHLASDGSYASDGLLSGGGRTPFDPRISTGAPVLGPIALVFTMTGPSVLAARLVVVCFFLALVLGVFLIATRAWGRWPGLVAVAAVLAATSAFDPGSRVAGPAVVKGEYPAAALVVCCALVLRRRPALSGALLGLAALTKTLSLVYAPGLLIVLVLSSGRDRSARAATWWCLGLVAPIAAWLAIIWASLGWAGFVANQHEYVQFVLHGGSGLGAPTSRGLTASTMDWADRVVTFAGTCGWLSVVIATTILGLWWLHRDLGSLSRPAKPGGDLAPVRALLAGSVLLALWWLFMSSTGWSRHLLMGALTGVPLALAWLVWRAQGALRSVPGQAVIATLVVLNIALSSYLTWRAPTGVVHDGPTSAAHATGDASARSPR